MKLFAVFLLVGLAFASAVPLFDDDLENELDQIADELGDEFIVYSEGGLGARLRERFEQLIEKIKAKVDEGKGFDKDLFKKAQDFYDKLKGLGVEISEKFKQIFEDLREKLGGNAEIGEVFIVHAEGGLADRLKKRFEEIVKAIKKEFEEGKGVNEALMKLAQNFLDRLKDLRVEISEKVKEMFEDLKSKMGGNSPQHADWQNWKERLRQLRDRIQNHEFDEEKIREFVERIFGKNEMTNQFLQILKTKGEKGKQGLIDWINRILGEKQEAFAPQRADFREHLRQLRDRIQNYEFDVEKLEELVKSLFGNSEMANHFLQILKSKGEKGKQGIIDWINRVLGQRQGAFAPQRADFREHLRQLRDRIQKHEFDEEKIRALVEKLFGKSEMTTQFLQKLKTVGEKGKQGLINFINRILGEKQEAFPFGDRLKEQFEKMLDNMKKAVDEGKKVSEDMWKKLQDMYEKLSNLGVEFNEKVKQTFEEMKSRFGKNSAQQVEFSIISRIKERLENLIGRMNKDMEDGKGVRGDLMKKLTDAYEKFKGLGGEMSQKFKDMFENLKSRFNKSSPVEHSVKEIYEKVKKFFRDLNIELKEKFVKFGEYVKEQYHKGLDKTKSNIDNVKNIAHKFVEDGRKISKDMAEEALEFFRQYKDDLGHIYEDVVDKVRDILKKED